ncbi:VWA domain-containing protein [Bifidobacterium pseudocatenulatum]|uniref:DUF7604 domain-containing protein n=1 Tax=Bifidobacterium pseudocatenulatum TaxID=28026 RepID=UPI001E364336|nr:FctA domain-containing protein [Bifidobacterium pseudocatenulatum]MDB6510694.1 VWA domain-containing protein [Bifidobacterium pseudocatenulatum]MDB6515366.1 VWA domain-containing protein [Bifidobacterium pseudocatenulatum]
MSGSACLTAKGCSNTQDSSDIQRHDGNGYLQLTDNSESKSGAVLYNQPVISKNGLHVSFDYYMYHKTSAGQWDEPADGISFFLTDGAATLEQTGAAGAGLGYATNDEDGTGSAKRLEGVSQGVLGIGLDRFGNFSIQNASGTKDRVTGGDDCGQWSSPQGSNSVTVRGKGSVDSDGEWTKGYCIVSSTNVASKVTNGLDTGYATNSADDANGKRVDITIAPLADANATTQRLTVKIGGVIVLEKDIDRLPDSVKFGFSASTGADHQVQLIRGLSVYSMTRLSQLDLVKSVNKDTYPDADTHVFKVGDSVPYTFVVRNSGNTQLNNITVNDPNITNVTCGAQTLAPGAQTQCSGTLTITESLVGENGTFTNTATATATDADGKSVTSPQAQATIHVNKPLGAPEKHKRIKKNNDGSYTVNVDVKGAASSTTVTTTQPIDFTLVLDVSGSMDDPMGSTDRTKRLDALKTAVDNFLDGAANANKGAQSGSEPVRVGLVKFSGKESNNVGNDMYRSGGYQYNYSQIVSKLTADMSGLKTKVNELKAAGSTRADNGFKRAVKVMENARTDAKKVVIFFADGTPSSVSDFDASVANGAVTAAKTLKDQGDMVYSIGIFASADPSSLSSKENQFMHAVSSNFPKAIAYNNRGDGDKDAGYYKAAKNASELNAIFDEIQKSETTTSAYTNVVMEDTLSEYVDLDDNTYKVVAKDASGQDVALTKDVDYTLTYDKNAKKFVVTFLKPLANSVTYTLVYNVKPTQKAYDEYASNLNAGGNGYGDVTGDADTDLAEDTTSSGQPGFRSNASACLAYTAENVNHQCSGNPYPHPVIQVVSSKLHIEKQWSGEGDEPESITVDIKQGNSPYATVTLTSDGNDDWSTDVIIPAGVAKTYTVTEAEPENHQWEASYQHKVGDGNFATGNTVAVPESTTSQNATVVITNTLKTATLKNAIGVKKELDGRDWKDSDKFTFKLEADDSNPNAPMPSDCKGKPSCTVTVEKSSSNHAAFFGDITYDAGDATYTYTVTENAGSASAMHYSQAEYQVVVAVWKKGATNDWEAVVESVTKTKTDSGVEGAWSEDKTQPMTFTNKYISASSLPLTGRMGAERWWQLAASGIGVLALLAVVAADQWRRKKRLG